LRANSSEIANSVPFGVSRPAPRKLPIAKCQW
jgi:hypothetical protein